MFYTPLGVVSALSWVFWVAELAFVVYALVHALTRPAAAFVAASKQTKPIWLAILGVATGVHLIDFGALDLLNIAGLVAALVYIVGVKPAIAPYKGGGKDNRHQGPYGPW